MTPSNAPIQPVWGIAQPILASIASSILQGSPTTIKPTDLTKPFPVSMRGPSNTSRSPQNSSSRSRACSTGRASLVHKVCRVVIPRQSLHSGSRNQETKTPSLQQQWVGDGLEKSCAFLIRRKRPRWGRGPRACIGGAPIAIYPPASARESGR